MLPISKQYLKSRCEIKTVENSLITTGILSDIAEDDIKIIKDTDFLSTLHCGTLVKIQVCNANLELKVLIGKVFVSSSEMLQITDIQNLTDFERRNFFRLKLSIHTQAYPAQQNGTPDQDTQLFQINITDLSLSGFFMKTRKTLEMGSCFIATIPLSDVRISFVCKVQRVQKANSRSNGYGCSFVNNSNRQFDQLCKYIFEKQREQIRSTRRDLY